MEQKEKGDNSMTSLGLFAISMVVWVFCTACTMTFSNTSVHGNSGDVADENVTTDPVIHTDLKVPLK